MAKNVVFLINKSEISAGTRGASLGPEAIMTAARKKGSQMFGENEVRFLPNMNYFLDKPTKFRYAKFIDGLITVYETLNTEVSKMLNNQEFPFILAGDHGSAGGTIAGIKSAFPTKRLGVVWIDAHADIHTPFTSPSGNIHGMPLATALAVDNNEGKSNDVDDQTLALWKQLKHIGSQEPKIKPEDLVYVAVRDVEKEERAIMERLQIHNIPVEEVRNLGIDQIIADINERLKNCDMIYISFDVDSMCPKLTSYGTGTPVENGLTPEEAISLLTGLAQNPKTICIEVVEVNPCLDNKLNTMAEITLGIIEAVLPIIKK